jgi:hypothetical protein
MTSLAANESRSVGNSRRTIVLVHGFWHGANGGFTEGISMSSLTGVGPGGANGASTECQ